MVNLGRLRCVQPGCKRERPLIVEPGGGLRCPGCGARRPAAVYFRIYGGRTAQWIIAGAVWLTVGYGRTGTLRAALLTVGVLCFAYALARILWQALARRALRQDGGGQGR